MKKNEEIKIDNSSKILFRIIASIILILVVVFGSYLYYFSKFTISSDPEKWAQFGDYVGGLLNSVIAILNLILIAYLTIKFANIEEIRSKNNLKDSVRPLGVFSFDISTESFNIKFHNVGLGPLIIKDFNIINDFEEIVDINNIIANIKLRYRPPFSLTKSTMSGTVIKKDDYLNIFETKIETQKNDEHYPLKLNDLILIKTEISKCSIEISYCDLYGNKIGKITEELIPVLADCN